MVAEIAPDVLVSGSSPLDNLHKAGDSFRSYGTSVHDQSGSMQ